MLLLVGLMLGLGRNPSDFEGWYLANEVVVGDPYVDLGAEPEA